MIHETIVGKGEYVDVLSCFLLQHVDALPDGLCGLHGHGDLLILDGRVDVESHVAHLVVVEGETQTIAEQILDKKSRFKFTVEQGADVVGQRIADLFAVPDPGGCEGQMIGQGQHDPAIHGAEAAFGFPHNRIGHLDKFRRHIPGQRFRGTPFRIICQPVHGRPFRLLKPLRDLLPEAKPLSQQYIFLIIIHINGDDAVIIQNSAHPIHNGISPVNDVKIMVTNRRKNVKGRTERKYFLFGCN